MRGSGWSVRLYNEHTEEVLLFCCSLGCVIVAVDCLVLHLPQLFEVIEYCFDCLDRPALVAFINIITSRLSALEEPPIHLLVPLCLLVQLRLLAQLCLLMQLCSLVKLRSLAPLYLVGPLGSLAPFLWT